MSAAQHFRSRSTDVIEAMQWIGNLDAERQWLGYAFKGVQIIDGRSSLLIENRSGRVNAFLGDWIVKLNDGFYPMMPDLFSAMYEPW